jgi:hypothetical protein
MGCKISATHEAVLCHWIHGLQWVANLTPFASGQSRPGDVWWRRLPAVVLSLSNRFLLRVEPTCSSLSLLPARTLSSGDPARRPVVVSQVALFDRSLLW